MDAVYTYDTLGRLHTTKKGNGPHALITRVERDLLNRITEEAIEDEAGNLYSHIFYEYDSAGNIHCLTRFVEGNETKEYFHYDSFNRPIIQIDALGHRTTIDYDEEHINSLNQRVLRKITTDALGIQTIETHDAHGRLVLLEKKNTFGEQITLEEMIYDLNGNLVRQISTVLFNKEPLRISEIHKEYNTLNSLITLIEGANSPEEKITRYTHTPTGIIDQIIKPDGTILAHTYDPLGRMLTQTSSDGTISYTFTYNALGHLLTSTDQNTLATTYRTYDARGRLLTETLANDLTIHNHYDQRGRRTNLILHDASSIHYDYGPLFLHQVTRYTSTHEPRYTHTYETFDTSGHLLEEHPIGNLPPLYHSYDPLGRTTSITSSQFKQQINTFDPVGNILETRIKTPYNTHIQTYRYDDLSQITEEHSPYPHTHTYDSHYNRLTTDSTSATYNSLNQLTSIEQTTYTYDLNGNLITKHTSEEETHYTYDALDRLLSIESPTMRARFTYDSFHRRLSKTIDRYKNGQWLRHKHHLYLYDDQNEIGATTSKGKIIQLRVLGSTPRAEIGAAIAIELSNQIYAPIHDLHGNVLALISLTTQETAESYQYSAFKEESVRDPTGEIHPRTQIKNPWRFSSKRIDEETGLIYYGRRYYDPEAARWITPDPLGYTIGMNLYSFVLNDPLIKIDLYGLEAIANQTNWWRTSMSTGMNYATHFVNTIGSIIYNTIYHLMPIPFIRQTGLFLTSWLAGKKPPNESSSRFSVGENNNLNRTSVIVTTGQVTFSKEGEEQAKLVSDQLNGERVVCVHNATHGILPDCIESLLGKMRIKSRSVGLLVRAIRSEIAALGGVDGGGTIFILPWSQGGIITDQALNQLTEAERKMIKVRSMGSASLFNRKDMDIQHFVSSADPVPWTAPINRLKASFSASTNVHVIKSRNKKFMPDHSFQSPTYQDILNGFTDEIKKHGSRS